ncbi:MFS transporter [Puniceibacterium sediminis]|uniref:Predicted arabinose efflux permease, MFS family n=1 Tax=Puniceibacterium sediminis TaxID=1608407 RepID=A0A238W5U7_9RHOB|nr:MFS transporter [Puniceibacterium sediminis]SNR41543.1 Predicted arabinose efflux permease, MFS family [Puniceibacterium sediminis]
MLQVLRSSWALLLGMLLLMLGNGLQGSLLGVRGGAEGFSAFQMSIVMSAYFAGFLFASRMTPAMIRRVGHVRVFAALGSFISAVIILYPAWPNPWVWAIGRVAIGFCFCGVYVTAESWLNNAATNENRGQALSLYMIVQTVGIIAAQGLLLIPDPSGFLLFVIPSVLVSIAFAPILLSISPTPSFETTKGMSLAQLYKTSPLGCVGMFLLGGVFAAQFGMSAVYGTEAGLSLGQISLFVSSFYVGAMVMQYPLGYMSDRMDRRHLVTIVAAIGGVAACAAVVLAGNYYILLGAAFLIGGASNPLYSLLAAYTNDFLATEDMASASAGLLFINGLGAITGPLITGWAMQQVGPAGYFILIAVLMLTLTAYALYRMTRRPAPAMDGTSAMAVLSPTGSPVAMAVAQEYAIEQAEAAEEARDAAA